MSTNLPGLRKFAEPARTYNAYRFLAQWLATDAWNLSFGVNGRNEDYDKPADLKEITDTVGLDATAKLAKSLRADVQWNLSRSNGKADLFNPPGGSPDVARGFDNYEDIEQGAVGPARLPDQQPHGRRPLLSLGGLRSAPSQHPPKNPARLHRAIWENRPGRAVVLRARV